MKDIKTIFATIKKYFVAIKTYPARRKSAKLKEQQYQQMLAELFTPFQDPTKQTLWQNQLNYFESGERMKYPTPDPKQKPKRLDGMDLMMRKLSKTVIDKLVDAIQPFVGLQPMSGPVGLCYYMKFIELEEDKLKLEICTTAVEAKSHRLSIGWTLEIAQDLHCLHGVDIEQELIQAVSDEIVTEYKQAILNDLANLNPTEEHTVTINEVPVILNIAANRIAADTKRGAANFIIVSPMILSLLQSSKTCTFVKASGTEDQKIKEKRQGFVGILNGTIKVYCDIYSYCEDTVIMGYKGSNGETDSGYFYCPYIPLMSSGVIINPQTFLPNVTLITRNGNKIIENGADYYKTLKFNCSFDDIVHKEVA